MQATARSGHLGSEPRLAQEKHLHAANQNSSLVFDIIKLTKL